MLVIHQSYVQHKIILNFLLLSLSLASLSSQEINLQLCKQNYMGNSINEFMGNLGLTLGAHYVF